MIRLVVGAVLSYDLEKMDVGDEYSIDEIVELLRINLQQEYQDYDLEVQVTDYMVEGD
jgi:hypothetical protein